MFNIERIKLAAQRLSDFIGQKHKIRIKQSTALEAIARMEGFNSWNDYVAQPNINSAQGCVLYPLVGHSDKSPVTISGFEFVRHILALGNVNEQRAWLIWQLNEHILKNHKGCFIDVLDLDSIAMSDSERHAITSAIDVVDFNKQSEDDILAKFRSSNKPVLANPRSSLEYATIQKCIQTYVTTRKGGDEIFSVAISGYDSGHFDLQLISQLIRRSRAYNVAMLCTTTNDGRNTNDIIHANAFRSIHLNTKSDVARTVLERYSSEASVFIESGGKLELY